MKLKGFTVRNFIGDAIVCLVLILLLALSAVMYSSFSKGGKNEYVRVLLDGTEIAVLPLDRNNSLSINGVEITVQNQRAFIESSGCPDKTCTRMHGVDSSGGTAVCLPRRVVLEPSRTDSDAHYIIG